MQGCHYSFFHFCSDQGVHKMVRLWVIVLVLIGVDIAGSIVGSDVGISGSKRRWCRVFPVRIRGLIRLVLDLVFDRCCFFFLHHASRVTFSNHVRLPL